MKTENLSISDMVAISQHFKGGLRGDAGLDAALVAGGRRGVFRRIAYLWRALLFSYPLVEGDRRTALIVAFIIFEKNRMALWDGQKKRMVSALLKVSAENISDISRIERLVRYAVEGD
jgi:hypothetical protein